MSFQDSLPPRYRSLLAYNVKQYLPTADHGNMLVTSRLSTLMAPRNSLRLTEVDRDQARAILEAIGGETMLGTIAAHRHKIGRPIKLRLTHRYSAR
jgi:hypothetical protein